jgi:hypothetical protein
LEEIMSKPVAPQPHEPTNELVTFTEASRRLGMSTAWWRAQARAGAFKSVKFGKSGAIPKEEWARILSEGVGPLRNATKGNVAA